MEGSGDVYGFRSKSPLPLPLPLLPAVKNHSVTTA